MGQFLLSCQRICRDAARGTLTAELNLMSAILLTTLGVCAVALLAEWLACISAPVGYQDEAGFHFGTKSTTNDDFPGNPS